MARVKICGIRSPDAFDAAAEADWVGFVFVPASPRAVTPEQAAGLSRRGPAAPARVGLFVDPTDAQVATVLSQVNLSALQLYTTPECISALRARFALPVWQACPVADGNDLPQAAPCGLPDAYILDARSPVGARTPGGNAVAFDWTVLHGWRAPAPWLLAGGLTPGNVASAISVSGARAVDVSSGVERGRGVKDPALIRAFVAAARTAQS